ncbi:MAG: hypothetical protein ACK5AZ_14375 [Bryobacteraceae bacterium]
MKYAAYFMAKLVAAAGLMYGIWLALDAWIPAPDTFLKYRMSRFAQDLRWTSIILVFTLVCLGLLYLIVLDQRFRCRKCLRRLRMPVATGSWANVFLAGRPEVEYICPFGHGLLRAPEVQIGGIEQPSWLPRGDIWQELKSLEGSKR